MHLCLYVAMRHSMSHIWANSTTTFQCYVERSWVQARTNRTWMGDPRIVSVSRNCMWPVVLHISWKKQVTENITCVNAKQVKVKPRVLDGKPRGGGIICPSKMYQLAKCSTAHSNHMKTEGGTRELLIISNYIFPDVAWKYQHMPRV